MAQVQQSMNLLPEYMENYIKDLLSNIYKVDEQTGAVTGLASKSPLEGTPLFQVDEEGNQVPINLYCAELNFDEGDCEAIDEDCTPGLIEDCNGICAPAGWLGDGFCDDGSYEYNGNPIFFDCEEFDFDNGDCAGQGRQTPRVLKGIFIGN